MHVRDEIAFPDIPGYRTLKCDFHTHTVFSDGYVWPDIRANEAWRGGLDVIAITDHIEYLPHKEDIKLNFNRSYEIARPVGDDLKVTVIRGAEITRSMPPGHANAIFLSDVSALATDRWQDAYKAAAAQDAFIFWNHPGWRGQQNDMISRWYLEHDTLVAENLLHGIEVVNERDYYPEAHAWCLEKGLTMLSNSDIHNPIGMDYALHTHDHRPITLVFAKEITEKAIRDALFDQRTAVYSGEMLIGEEKFLLPLFQKSVTFDEKSILLTGTHRVHLQVRNNSAIDYRLSQIDVFEKIAIPTEITLYAGKTVLFTVWAKDEALTGVENYQLTYRVENALIAPDEGMPVKFKLKVKFKPE